MSALIWAAGLVQLAGCGPKLGEVPFFCNRGTPRCPDGYECKADRWCVKKGTCPEVVPECLKPEGCENGTCDADETPENCPQDCPAATCGNDQCEPTEDGKSCPKDCRCGDGVCSADETPAACSQDCVSTCGNKTCDEGVETRKNCPADCPLVCGDSKCDLGETPQSCPKDCGGGSCGDKNCDPGETTSCPADCTTCTAGTSKCEGTDKLQECVAGSWKTSDCNVVCTGQLFDYASGCEYSSTKAKDVCVCGKYVAFGGLCDEKKKCDTTLSLFCGTFGTSTTGFCTKYCTTSCSGSPSGTYASCSLNVSGKMACGFECDYYTKCPTGLTCDTSSNLCKP